MTPLQLVLLTIACGLLLCALAGAHGEALCVLSAVCACLSCLGLAAAADESSRRKP